MDSSVDRNANKKVLSTDLSTTLCTGQMTPSPYRWPVQREEEEGKMDNKGGEKEEGKNVKDCQELFYRVVQGL